ncbi:hypothetical protein BDD43_4229 [Mucilaginibacter gracilis]|uniref:Glycosyl hydrolase n=1 Tax=Mucilaginibacter gracilis TaxID=423350 RepID=A0A495J5W2_9SPHI|nr:hypothetical protein [Mucilaginibacter gracilis]RKR84012.1 hypothetical protein BDD43_4229 [Mucilaginibacter gracilis]
MKNKNKIGYFCLGLLTLGVTSCKTEKLIDPEFSNASFRTLSISSQRSLTPTRAADYVNSIGVNVHLTFVPYHDHFYDIVYPKLKLLGIKHVRGGVPYKGFLSTADTGIIKTRFIILHDSLGIKTNYSIANKKVVDSLNLRDGGNYLSVFQNNSKLVQTIQSLEGFNEPDLTIYGWYPSNYDTLTYKIQKGLYNKTHSMPELAGIPVVSTSITAWWSSPSRPNKIAAITPSISNYFDYANFHLYDAGDANYKMFPGTYYDLTKSFFPPVRNGKPYVVTETGYENARYWNQPGLAGYNSNTYHYLSELSSGKYYSVMFMEELSRGAQRVYAYEFMDENTSDQTYSENNFGLIHTDGTVKPAFTAIKNTIDLLKDVNTPFVPTSLSFMMTGDTTNVKTMLFQKADGRYYLAFWQGVKKTSTPNGINYDFPNFQDLPDDVQNVQVTFTYPFSTAKTYIPLQSASPVTSGINIVTISIPVPDQLLILELNP